MSFYVVLVFSYAERQQRSLPVGFPSRFLVRILRWLPILCLSFQLCCCAPAATTKSFSFSASSSELSQGTMSLVMYTCLIKAEHNTSTGHKLDLIIVGKQSWSQSSRNFYLGALLHCPIPVVRQRHGRKGVTMTVMSRFRSAAGHFGEKPNQLHTMEVESFLGTSPFHFQPWYTTKLEGG